MPVYNRLAISYRYIIIVNILFLIDWSFAHQNTVQLPINTLSTLVYYSENKFLALPDAKKGNFIKQLHSFLKSSMDNHIFVAFWQSDALKGFLFSDFALKSDSAL